MTFNVFIGILWSGVTAYLIVDHFYKRAAIQSMFMMIRALEHRILLHESNCPRLGEFTKAYIAKTKEVFNANLHELQKGNELHKDGDGI